MWTRVTACSLIAQLGLDKTQFPDPAHLPVGRAGVRQLRSAGKRKTGKTRKGNLYLRRSL